MATKKFKGLGRGLEALLGPKVEEKVEQAQAVQAGARQLLADGPLDLVVYCAGHYKAQRAYDFDLGEMLRHQEINYVGALHVLGAVLPAMLARACATMSALRAATAGSSSRSPVNHSKKRQTLVALPLPANGELIVMTSRTRPGRRCATSRAIMPPRLTPISVTGPFVAAIVSRRSMSCSASAPVVRAPKLRPKPQLCAW